MLVPASLPARVAVEMALQIAIDDEDAPAIERALDQLLLFSEQGDARASDAVAQMLLEVFSISGRESGLAVAVLQSLSAFGLVLVGAAIAVLLGGPGPVGAATMLLVLGAGVSGTSMGLWLRRVRWASIAKKADILWSKNSALPRSRPAAPPAPLPPATSRGSASPPARARIAVEAAHDPDDPDDLRAKRKGRA